MRMLGRVVGEIMPRPVDYWRRYRYEDPNYWLFKCAGALCIFFGWIISFAAAPQRPLQFAFIVFICLCFMAFHEVMTLWIRFHPGSAARWRYRLDEDSVTMPTRKGSYVTLHWNQVGSVKIRKHVWLVVIPGDYPGGGQVHMILRAAFSLDDARWIDTFIRQRRRR